MLQVSLDFESFLGRIIKKKLPFWDSLKYIITQTFLAAYSVFFPLEHHSTIFFHLLMFFPQCLSICHQLFRSLRHFSDLDFHFSEAECREVFLKTFVSLDDFLLVLP
jgi:hypothetical protein